MAKEKEDTVLNEFINQFEYSKKWRASCYDDFWHAIIDDYHAVVEPKPYPWQVNLFIPLIWETIETFLPKLVGRMPEPDAAPEYNKDAMAYVEIINMWMKWAWEISRMQKKLIPFEKQGLILGTAIGRVDWMHNVVEKYFIKEKNEALTKSSSTEIYNLVKEQSRTRNEPIFDWIDLFDFFPTPFEDDIDKMPWCFVYDEIRMSEVKRLMDSKLYDKSKLKDISPADANDISPSSRGENQKVIGLDDKWRQKEVMPDDAIVSRLIRYRNDRLTIVINKKVIVYDDKYPHKFLKGKPIVVSRNYLDLGKFYGIGEPEKMQPLNYAINDIYNCTIENLKISLNKMWAADPMSDVDDDLLIAQPGLVVHASPNDIAPLTQGNTPPEVFNILDLLRQHIRNAVGNTMIFEGVEGKQAPETLGAYRMLAENIVNRFNMKQFLLEVEGIEPIMQKMLQLSRQYINEATSFKITGERGTIFETITPQILNEDYEIKVIAKSGSAMSREAEMRHHERMIGMLMPHVGQYRLNLLPLIKDYLKAADYSKLDMVCPPEDIIAEPTPEVEHWIMANIGYIAPRPNEDFKSHMLVHNQFTQSEEYQRIVQANPQFGDFMNKHMEETQMLMQNLQMKQKTIEGMLPAKETEQEFGLQTRGA